MGITKLLYSTNFWTALFGFAAALLTFHISKSESVTLAVVGLFGFRIVAKGAQDYGMTRSFGGSNPPPGKDEK